MSQRGNPEDTWLSKNKIWWTKECGECGKIIPLYMYDATNYAYKRIKYKNNTSKVTYFCCYSCMKKFDQVHIKYKRKKEEAAV